MIMIIIINIFKIKKFREVLEKWRHSSPPEQSSKIKERKRDGART
jgi:hypothetical protein